jgi:uncharacterized protein YdaU (DUF1376 family)
MAKETFYFSHDYNTRSDPKIKRLIAKHGMQGYGVYWSIIEDLYNNENSLPLQTDIMCFDLRCSEQIIDSVLNDFDLFEINDGNFGSPSVERRLNDRAEKSNKARKNAMNRWNKQRDNNTTASNYNANASKNDAVAMQKECDSNAIKESKGKEIKVKESKEYKKALLSEILISDYPELKTDYVEIAKAFQLLFKANLVDAGASTVNVDKAKGNSIDDVRLLLETDKYTIEDLRSVYEFLQQNSFWKKNILSTSKLREKMDKLKLEIKNVDTR